MKKTITTIFIALLIFGFVFSASAKIYTTHEANEKLSEFIYGESSEINGAIIDYYYFSPVKENDRTKYPLVIWFHGMGDGKSPGAQLTASNIAAWATEDYQRRFTGTGGAFIIAPRSAEGQAVWNDSLIYIVRATIDEFIANNRDNIDISRIYVGGYSMGGKMTLKMLSAYPEMFAAGFPICPAWVPGEEVTACFKEVPIWLTSGAQDPLVNYFAFASTTWNNIISQSNVAEISRFSTLTSTLYPDGNRAYSAHLSWFSVNNDMFSSDNGDYPKMKTVNGNGEKVILQYPEGMISWLSGFESDYDGSPATDGGNKQAYTGFALSFFGFIKAFFQNLAGYIKLLFI
ncbi:MAG: hypothetical protein J6Q79_01955 [Clostridia bacterium]|nr:hypothetical protein [Clostridia bacterium]